MTRQRVTGDFAVTPAVPENLDCISNMYPNYGRCKITGYDDDNEGAKPTSVRVFYALADSVNSEFDWERDARNVTVEFGEFGRAIEAW